MTEIWYILAAFVFRATFGVALSMFITPPRIVDSAFFRVHLWVLMGANTFAALLTYTGRPADAASAMDYRWLVGLAGCLALLSYVGAVLWLYEKQRAGRFVLGVVCCGALLAATLADVVFAPASVDAGFILAMLIDSLTAGLLMGSLLTAMFLGHWYLNNPSMQLMPIERLVGLLVIAALVRGIACGVAVLVGLGTAASPATSWWLFFALRWVAGLVGVLVMALMTAKTLKVPNTQSATGILYAGVILVFIGELTAALLSREMPYFV